MINFNAFITCLRGFYIVSRWYLLAFRKVSPHSSVCISLIHLKNGQVGALASLHSGPIRSARSWFLRHWRVTKKEKKGKISIKRNCLKRSSAQLLRSEPIIAIVSTISFYSTACAVLFSATVIFFFCLHTFNAYKLHCWVTNNLKFSNSNRGNISLFLGFVCVQAGKQAFDDDDDDGGSPFCLSCCNLSSVAWKTLCNEVTN